MFSEKINPNDLNSISKNTLLSHLGIEFSEIKNNYIVARMPVIANTSQPMGLLHGGASVTLAESIGSIGSHLLIDNESENAVGVEINANHISSVKKGYVTGKGTIIHKGKSTHVWSIDIRDQDEKLISTARLTVMILKKSKQ